MRKADKLLMIIPTFQKRILQAAALLILILLLSFAHVVFADNNDGVISRPVIEYSSGDLRDPFSDLLQLAVAKEQKTKEEENVQMPLDTTEPQKPFPGLDKFKVQGVIWGGKFTQVIINDKILGVGDLIEGVEIAKIDKKEIVLNFAGRMASLAIPGNAPVSVKGDKEEK